MFSCFIVFFKAPHIFFSSLQEESHPPEVEKEEPVAAPVIEESKKSTENSEERRTMAIAAKAKEIEKVHVLYLLKTRDLLIGGRGHIEHILNDHSFNLGAE